MPSFLMPVSSSEKELHDQLLDFLADATSQYNSMNALNIPEKIKIKAHNDYNTYVEFFITLPTQESLFKLVNDKPINSYNYRLACREQYRKFIDFYDALEKLMVRHYLSCQNHTGNDYLLNALNKIPDDTKNSIKEAYEMILASPRNYSPRNSPRDNSPRSSSPRAQIEDVVTSTGSPSKRRNSHSIVPSFWLSATQKNAEHKAESTWERSKSFFKQ